jgi:hypothetical protein
LLEAWASFAVTRWQCSVRVQATKRSVSLILIKRDFCGTLAEVFRQVIYGAQNPSPYTSSDVTPHTERIESADRRFDVVSIE